MLRQQSRKRTRSGMLLFAAFAILQFSFVPNAVTVVDAKDPHSNSDHHHRYRGHNGHDGNGHHYRNPTDVDPSLSSAGSAAAAGISATATPAPSKSPSTRPPPPPLRPPPPPSLSSIFQVLESEIWDAADNVWKAATPSRWTTTSGETCDGPTDIRAPDGFRFVGDWKIVVQTGRDSLGWEYHFRYLQQASRQRIWLRTIQPREQAKEAEDEVEGDGDGEVAEREEGKKKIKSKSISSSSSSSKERDAHVQDEYDTDTEDETEAEAKAEAMLRPQRAKDIKAVVKPKKDGKKAATGKKAQSQSVARTAATKTRKKGRSRASKVVQAIQDEYNFKGFGVTVLKSFIFPSSIGVSVGLPLTANFDSWDRNPGLPRIASSVFVGFPWCIAGFLSTSLHVEWIKWVFSKSMRAVTRFIILSLYTVFVRGFYMALSTLLYPFLRRRHELPTLRPLPPMDKPNYNPDISERVGMSLSYRWSMARGFEGRVSYWHSYLPTFVAYRRVFNSILQLVGEPTENIGWWQTHFGSLGFILGCPIPVPPKFSCSAQLSLSGFYLENALSKIGERRSIARNAKSLVEDSDDEDSALSPDAASSLRKGQKLAGASEATTNRRNSNERIRSSVAVPTRTGITSAESSSGTATKVKTVTT